MRIIAGSARRLRLKTPDVPGVRPTTDRIKETLFNIIQDEVPGSCFLDLFAGSGQIGLEALSRGAHLAVFVDSSKQAVSCIKENIAVTRFEEKAKLFCSDALGALRRMEGKYKFDIIFMDPPYGQQLEQEVLSFLSASSMVTEDTLLIAEAALGTGFPYLEDMKLELQRLKTYKTNEHAFIRRKPL